MSGILEIALGLAPLAQDAVRVVSKNSLAELVRLVEADVRRSSHVAPGRREDAAKAWSRQRVDPQLGGQLTAWLATGDDQHLDEAAERWRTLLAGQDWTEEETETLVDIGMKSARRNLSAAQPSDREAGHVEAESTRTVVARAATDVKEHISRELAVQGARSVPPFGRVCFNLPRVAAAFAGREAQLAELHAELAVADNAVITQAIGGLGGVGKSQLAARYLELHSRDYDIVAWIRTEDGGIADLAQLATKLGVAGGDLSPSDRAQLALDRLGECEQRWLLVLDNITAPEQLTALRPCGGNGRVLVTSRDRSLRQFGPVLTVDVFDEDTAVGYLIERAGRPDDVAAARELAKALGFLPLALSHAAAYCQDGTSFAKYQELLRELPARELFDSHPQLGYTLTVVSTWKPSIEAAKEAAPLAGHALELAAHLAPDAIPKSLFAVLLDGGAAASARERKRLTDALNALARFSLATVEDETVGVHRLLQQVIREELVEREERGAAKRALAAVTAAFPHDTALPARWPACERLLPHVLALADAPSRVDAEITELLGLLSRACEYLARAEPGRRGGAVAHHALSIAERNLGSEHPQTLGTRNNLARAFQHAGRTADAIEIYEPLLHDRQRILGSEHPHTLGTRGSLAIAYKTAGRTADAIAIYEPLLADQQRILGSEHPHTLATRGNLATAYRVVGRTPDAIAIYELLLTDQERILGSEHPDMLSTRNNLAACYQHAGGTADAIAIYQPLLADQERILDSEHPDTLRTRNNLATEAGWVSRRPGLLCS